MPTLAFRDVRWVSGFVKVRIQKIMKARLLAGVGFALAMNWGQTGYNLHDYHVELGLGPRHSASPSAGVGAQTPLRPSRSVLFATFACPRIQIYKL